MSKTKAEAIARLRPGAEWVLRGDTLVWLDGIQTEPSAQEIATEMQKDKEPDPRQKLLDGLLTKYAAEVAADVSADADLKAAAAKVRGK